MTEGSASIPTAPSDRERGLRPASSVSFWWGIVAFAAAASAYLSMNLLVAVIASTVLRGKSQEELIAALVSPTSVCLQVLCGSGALALLSFVFPKALKVSARELLRLAPCPLRIHAAAVVGVLGLGFLVDEALYLLHTAAPGVFSTSGLSVLGGSFASASMAGFAVMTAAVALGPGLGEELFFRGLMLRSLRNKLPAGLAVVLSSIAFGALHMDMLQGTGAAMIGAFFGFVALRSKSLWPGVVAHAVNNLVSALFSRYGGGSPDAVFEEGHAPSLLAAAAAVFALAVIGLLRFTRQPETSTGGGAC